MSAEASHEELFSPALLEAIREKFLHADGDPFGPRIYLENAGGSLTLKAVLAAGEIVGSLPDNAGRDNAASRAVGCAIKTGREDVAVFLNAKEGTILSEQSTTACAFRILDAAARGVPGRNIVCSALDHASFHDAAQIIAQREGFEFRVAPLDRSTGALDPDAVAREVDTETICVSIIHASNITGGRTDLATTVAKARARAPQAIIVVDGAQHVQHGVVDVAATGVDAYAFSAYKVFSKPGFGFAYLSPRLASLPHAQLVGKATSDWDLGTRDPAGFAAFSCVLDYFEWLATQISSSAGDRRTRVEIALNAIGSHEAALSRLLLHGDTSRPGLLHHKRVQLHGQRHHSAGREAVFAFSIAGMPTGLLVREFGRRGIVLHDRVSDAYSRHTLHALGVEGTVRVSLAHYNTPSEVDTFLRALGEIAAT